jgi:hypothetical protein
MTAMMAPLAYWQLGVAGLVVLSAAALTVVSAVVVSGLALHFFALSANPLAGMLIAMAARMLLPLVFAVSVLLWNPAATPAWSAMYVAPLYFVMLIAETAFALRHCRSLPSTQPGWLNPLSQIVTGEGK